MEKIIDGIITAAFIFTVAAGGRYTLHQVVAWSQKMAFEKAAQGLGKLEPSTQKMTGEKLDF